MNFDTASSVLYPQMNDIASGTSGSKAIEAQVAQTLEGFRNAPGGAKLTARKLETIQTKRGLTFEIWLYNNGAPANAFEAVAYHAGENALFFLVLSAKTQAERDNALPVLKNTVEEIRTMKVSGQ